MNEPLRVLLVAQPTLGGTAVCVRELVEAGVEAGIKMQVACPSDDHALASDVETLGALWQPLDLRRPPELRDASHVVRLRQLARQVDVVHLHSSKAGAVGRLAARSLGSRRPAVAFTPHGWSWQSGGPLVPAYRRFERTAARWADAIVAVSDEERERGQRVLGPDIPVDVIHNGVDIARFAPDGERASRHPDPLIVCVGRLAFPKGQDVALRALAILREARTRLRLVGDGPDGQKLLALADELGVTDRLELTGHAQDAAPHLRAADVVLVPSFSEGQSVAMLEAMACGRVVVTTDVAGASSVGETGAVVPVGDVAAIAAALDDALARPDWRAEKGEAARRRAKELFDRRIMRRQHVELWQRLADARTARL